VGRDPALKLSSAGNKGSPRFLKKNEIERGSDSRLVGLEGHLGRKIEHQKDSGRIRVRKGSGRIVPLGVEKIIIIVPSRKKSLIGSEGTAHVCRGRGRQKKRRQKKNVRVVRKEKGELSRKEEAPPRIGA